MNNMELYNKVRSVPENAQKEIKGGRLKGMTDINPQWRIQTLTEQFGMCGFGWKVEIVRLWLENGANEITANAEIKLFVKVDGEWSDGIVGIGGSKLVAVEKDGAYTSDECYKMAVTDAISVACKMLGFGADIYWQQNRTKYQNVKPASEFNKKLEEATHGNELHCSECDEVVSEKVAKYSLDKFGRVLCYNCQKRPKEQTNIKEVNLSGDELPF